MTSKIGLSMVSLGTLVVFFGLLRLFVSFGDMIAILLWSSTTVAGVFVLAAGIYRTMMDADAGDRGHPDAVGLTGPRYGLRR